MSTVEAYCRDAALGYQRSKDAAQAELDALLNSHRLPVDGFDMPRWMLEQRVRGADGMIRWFLSSEGQEFVRSVTR